MNDYNPADLHAAATSLEQMATTLTAALPTSAAVPPAADPVSVVAAANLNARSAAVRNAITAAINEATATAHHLRLAANRFDDTNTANAASLGGSGAAVPAASIRPTTPPPPLPTVPVPPAPANAFVPPDPEVDPEPVALALHAGPGAAALAPHATEWKSTATALDDSATSTTGAASTVRSAWDAPEGHAAAANITKLGTWMTSAASHADGIASASTAHAASFTAAHAAHPDPATISTAKQRVVELSTAATADPAAIPALTAAHTHLIDLARQGASTTVSYHADTTRNAPPSTPPTDPPKVTSNGSGDDAKKKSKSTKPKKPGEPDDADTAGDAGDQISATTSPAAAAAGGTDPSIAADGTRLAEQQIAQQQDQKLLQTGMQIGTQVAQQVMQGLQQGVSTAAQVTSKLGGSGVPAPGSSFTSPDIGLSDSSFGGGGGGFGGGGGGGGGFGGGGLSAAGGDSLGTEPSGFEGALAPSTPSTALPPAVEGTTPTTSSPPGKSGSSMPMGSMMHPPMMGGMGAGAGGGERQRNHDIYPDRKVFDDDTEYTDDTIGKLPDIAPSITPAFNDGTGTSR